MRCLSCNKWLNDFESTRKSATTGKYIDLCNGCFKFVEQDIPVIVRKDLEHTEDECDEDQD